ncbi:porin [Massilia niabensis]|uniref:Porin n=1 Tax=Massilia niabensis TaxID=544910 RepID=A0ABW0L551_9BURK
MKTVSLRLTCCILLLSSPAAWAQHGPLVYGLVDLHLGHTTHVNPDGGNALRIGSGGMNSSRLGFAGSEALGGGLKAVYQLEMGIAADTGVADTPLFKRQATVGLEGRFGSLLAGRAFTTVYDFLLPYDPMGYAPFYSWAPTGNGSGSNKYGMTLAFDNMLKYAGKSGSLSYGASLGAGEGSASADGAKAAAAVNYARGPLAFVAAAERINANAPAGTGERTATTTWHLGAMFGRGPWKLQAAVRDYRRSGAQPGLPSERARLYWAGANYQATPATTLTGALYYQEVQEGTSDADADPAMVVARVRHALSRRTDLYLVAAYARAGQDRRVSLSRDEAGSGDSQRSVLVGIQHRF